MRENSVWLSPEELKHMLQGTLQWTDMASRITISKKGMRKLGETGFEKQSAPKQAVYPENYRLREKDKPFKLLEGQPVIWLLGSVGLLTLSSYFYYVFAK